MATWATLIEADLRGAAEEITERLKAEDEYRRRHAIAAENLRLAREAEERAIREADALLWRMWTGSEDFECYGGCCS